MNIPKVSEEIKKKNHEETYEVSNSKSNASKGFASYILPTENVKSQDKYRLVFGICRNKSVWASFTLIWAQRMRYLAMKFSQNMYEYEIQQVCWLNT